MNSSNISNNSANSTNSSKSSKPSPTCPNFKTCGFTMKTYCPTFVQHVVSCKNSFMAGASQRDKEIENLKNEKLCMMDQFRALKEKLNQRSSSLDYETNQHIQTLMKQFEQMSRIASDMDSHIQNMKVFISEKHKETEEVVKETVKEEANKMNEKMNEVERNTRETMESEIKRLGSFILALENNRVQQMNDNYLIEYGKRYLLGIGSPLSGDWEMILKNVQTIPSKDLTDTYCDDFFVTLLNYNVMVKNIGKHLTISECLKLGDESTKQFVQQIKDTLRLRRTLKQSNMPAITLS